MTIKIENFNIHTNGFGEVIDITQKIAETIKYSQVHSGILLAEVDSENIAIILLKNSNRFLNLFNKIFKTFSDYDQDEFEENENDINLLKTTILGRKFFTSFENSKLNIKNGDRILLIDNNMTSSVAKITIVQMF